MKKIGEDRFNEMYLQNVKNDKYIHFTTPERASEIVKSGSLLMDPPYRKFGTDTVNAISLAYGKYIPTVQHTHHGDVSLVGILFSTDTIPKIGFREEVAWKTDVNLINPKIISYDDAVNALSGFETSLDEDGEPKDLTVYYAMPSELTENVKINNYKDAINQVQTNGIMIGYKVMRSDGTKLFSGADSRLSYNKKIGTKIEMDRNGIFLALSKEYVLDYYSGLADEESLLTLEFDESDIVSGNLNDKEAELGVKKVVITKIQDLDEGEIINESYINKAKDLTVYYEMPSELTENIKINNYKDAINQIQTNGIMENNMNTRKEKFILFLESITTESNISTINAVKEAFSLIEANEHLSGDMDDAKEPSELTEAKKKKRKSKKRKRKSPSRGLFIGGYRGFSDFDGDSFDGGGFDGGGFDGGGFDGGGFDGGGGFGGGDGGGGGGE